MEGWAWVTDHPFIAVTDKDGYFKLENVPLENVRIVAWHEPKEYLNQNAEDGEPLQTPREGELTKNFEASFR
jgi:hypothetical protein